MSLLVALAAFTALLHTPSTPSGCLRYAPDTARISGVLLRKTFYGAPGYGEDPKHDEKETGYYLRLPAPACTLPGRDAELDQPLKGVRLVQLVLDERGYNTLRPYLGRRVTLLGTLFGQYNGHHHAPIVLDVLKPAQVEP